MRASYKLEFKRFFSKENSKAIKANGYNWHNPISYMTPHLGNGLGANLCSNASPQCILFCLGPNSGHAAIIKSGESSNAVLDYRMRKTHYFLKRNGAFMRELLVHIAKEIRTAKRLGFRICVRLNGATDIAFENVAVVVDEALAAELTAISGMKVTAGKHTAFSCFPKVQYVDYTKKASRFDKVLPNNYDLTFSRSELNDAECLALLARGHNVAVIFKNKFPKSWNGYRVINGDKHDLRHLDPCGVVVGLTPKGKMRNSDSPFMVAA